MWQHTQLFYRLEAIETMRAYIDHNMDDSENLHARLETIESEVVVARKLAEEGAYLLRRAKEENETTQAEAHWLAEEMKVMEVGKKKVEGEARLLR